ncbi:type II toxin-antitoxin system RelE/ParE family toxin [Amorphus sp. MBR-141]
MEWDVLFHEALEGDFTELPEAVQDELLAHAELLVAFGPSLKRPRADTLKGSRHANMKELRFDANDAVWRLACCLCVRPGTEGHPAGRERQVRSIGKRFYRRLIATADERFESHLSGLSKKGGR